MTDRCKLGFMVDAPLFAWPTGDLVYLFNTVDNIRKIARIKADLSSVVSVSTVSASAGAVSEYRGFLDGNIFFAAPQFGTQYVGINVNNGNYAGTVTLPLLTSTARSLFDTRDYVYYPSSTGNKIVKFYKDEQTYTAVTIAGGLTLLDDYGLFWDDPKGVFLISDNSPTTHTMRVVDPDTGEIGGYYGGVQSALSGAIIDAYRGYMLAGTKTGLFGVSSNNVGMSVFELTGLNSTSGITVRAYKTHAQIATAIGTSYYTEGNYLASNGDVFIQGNADAAGGGGPSLFLLDTNLDIVATMADIGGWYITSYGAKAAFMWE